MGLDHLCSTGGMKIMVNFISIDPCITVHVIELCRQGIVSSRNTWEPWHCRSCVLFFFVQWVQIDSSLLIANTGMKLVDMHVQEMNVTSQLRWSCIVSSAVHWYFHQNFGPESLGPPDQNFQWKNGPLGPIFFSLSGHTPWNLVWVMQVGKPVSGTLNTCKEVFSLSTAPTFPHVLVPVWSLSLTGWELLSWDSARR